jgi:cytochrome c biogenesis protein ResB
MKKINLASTRLAFVLLALFAVLIVISALIPQHGIAQDQVTDWRALLGDGYVVIEKLRLDRIYSSPVFLAVVALLMANLIAGNVKRIRRLVQIRSGRGRLRLLGSIVFHFALPLIMAGAVLNHMQKSRVIFGLTEGQQVSDVPGAYFRDFSGPWSGGPTGRFSLRLESIDTEWPVGGVTTEAAQIAVAGPGSSAPETGHIRVNHPLRRGNLEFHLGAQIGFSPELFVTDSDGTNLFRSFVRLARNQSEEGAVDLDYVFLDDKGTQIELRMLIPPKAGVEPQTQVAVQQNGTEVYKGIPGVAGVALPDGKRIAVPRLRRWCYVEAMDNPFMNLVFAGFWIALAGLTVTLIPRMLPARRSAQ